jgi:hypothetical protein
MVKTCFAKYGFGKGFDGLGRKYKFKKPKIGDTAKISDGSGLDSKKIGILINKKGKNGVIRTKKGEIIEISYDRLEAKTKC